MIFSTLVVYSQSIEESNIGRIGRNMKRSGQSYQRQSRFKKKVLNQDESWGAKVTLEMGSGSQGGKPTCATCGKTHYGQCLMGTRSLFVCGKDEHKVRDCPTISSREREGRKVPPSFAGGDARNKNHFYALRTRG